MHVTLWGVRGSIPVPGPAAAGFGGNTPVPPRKSFTSDSAAVATLVCRS